MNKKGMALAVVAVVLALTILAIYIVGVATRECNSNNDCAAASYCGSDFSCHEYPSQVVVENNKFVISALILGVCLIIAAYVYRAGKLPPISKPIKDAVHKVKDALPKEEDHGGHEHHH